MIRTINSIEQFLNKLISFVEVLLNLIIIHNNLLLFCNTNNNKNNKIDQLIPG